MTQSININFVRIHFTWINWSLEYQKRYRKRISEALKEERIKKSYIKI